jgi:hypothetical protein
LPCPLLETGLAPSHSNTPAQSPPWVDALFAVIPLLHSSDGPLHPPTPSPPLLQVSCSSLAGSNFTAAAGLVAGAVRRLLDTTPGLLLLDDLDLLCPAPGEGPEAGGHQVGVWVGKQGVCHRLRPHCRMWSQRLVVLVDGFSEHICWDVSIDTIHDVFITCYLHASTTIPTLYAWHPATPMSRQAPSDDMYDYVFCYRMARWQYAWLNGWQTSCVGPPPSPAPSPS